MPRERARPHLLLQSFVNGQLVRELMAREFKGVMPQDQFAVQSVINVLGPIRPTELAARLGMPPATLSAWIARLDEAGQLRKTPNPDDGRSYLIELTDVGRKAVLAAVPAFAASLARVEEELGDDLERVEEAALRCAEALRVALDSSSDSK